MTKEQEGHLKELLIEFSSNLNQKYRRGQAEHGGNVWDRDVTEDACQEAIDNVVYVFTAREKNRRIIHILRHVIQDLSNNDSTQSAKFKIQEVITLLEGKKS